MRFDTAQKEEEDNCGKIGGRHKNINCKHWNKGTSEGKWALSFYIEIRSSCFAIFIRQYSAQTSGDYILATSFCSISRCKDPYTGKIPKVFNMHNTYT